MHLGLELGGLDAMRHRWWWGEGIHGAWRALHAYSGSTYGKFEFVSYKGLDSRLKLWCLHIRLDQELYTLLYVLYTCSFYLRVGGSRVKYKSRIEQENFDPAYPSFFASWFIYTEF